MEKIHIFAYNYLLHKIESKLIYRKGLDEYLKSKKYLNKKVMNTEGTNQFTKEKILSGKPFMAARLGGVELSCMRNMEFKVKSKYDISLKQMQNNAGFFPPTVECGNKFLNLMTESIQQVDLIGLFKSSFELYYLKKYSSNDIQYTNLFDLEPWRDSTTHWSSALKGKKVLVIHPLSETIQKQYLSREKIFPNTDILPEFELKTLKAVQTIAGQKDERFETWFDALDWMYNEAMKIDFDIAIIGCGAYGFPLAAKIKKAGKQAIHLGGATQLMFGIKGRRWLEITKDNRYGYIQKYFNEYWVFPSDEDKPRNAKNVEDGCYW